MNKSDLSKITIIMRGLDYESISPILECMNQTNFNSIEVTSNSPDPHNTIEKIKSNFPGIRVGAGTVTNLKDAKEFIKSGAEFILSPISLDKETITFCKDNDILCIPAAFSPTEVFRMFELGADIVKVFPATALGSKYFKDIQAPLGKLDLMAVGGINLDNAKEYLSNNCNYLGIGTGMFKKEDIIYKNRDGLKRSLMEYQNIIGE